MSKKSRYMATKGFFIIETVILFLIFLFLMISNSSLGFFESLRGMF